MTDTLVQMPRGIMRERAVRSLNLKQRKFGDYCEHPSWEMDEKIQRLKCVRCGYMSDAFPVLVHLVREHDAMLMARHELATLRKEIQELKAERTKLKASIDGLRRRHRLQAAKAEEER